MKKILHTVWFLVFSASIIAQIPDPCTGAGASQPINAASPCNCGEAQAGSSCNKSIFTSQSGADNAIHNYLTAQSTYALPTIPVAWQDVRSNNMMLNNTYKHEFSTEFTTGPSTTVVAVINICQVQQNCNAVCQDYKIIHKTGGTCGINISTPVLVSSLLDPAIKYRQYTLSPSTTYIISRQIYFDGSDIDCYLSWVGSDAVSSTGAKITAQHWFIWSPNVLPIKITGFSGINLGNSNLLQWSLDNAADIGICEIERSDDGNNYTQVGTVSASSNTNNLLQFDFTDMNIYGRSMLYYRLKIYDKHGGFIYSKIVSINEKSSRSTFTIFPNPASDITRLMIFADHASQSNVELIDQKGAILYSENFRLQIGTNNILIDLSPFAKGIYQVRMFNEKSVSTQKLIKL